MAMRRQSRLATSQQHHTAKQLGIAGSDVEHIVRKHAREALACDFFLMVTTRFRLLYAFLVLDAGTHRLVHWNVTEHPTAAWVVQQFRMCMTGESTCRLIVHNRDRIYSQGVDLALRTDGSARLENTSGGTSGERPLRTRDRDGASRVPGLGDSFNERHFRRILAE